MLESENGNNDLFEAVEIGHNYSTSCIGLVVHANNSYYTENYAKNLEQRMPVTHDEVIKALNEYFTKKHKYIKNILAGHEWGEKNGRCHYQCILEFDKTYKIISEIGTLFKDDKTCLIIYQRARHSKNLKKYCEKSNDYKVLYPDVMICGDIWDKIYDKRKELTNKQALEMLIKDNPKQTAGNFNNINNFVNYITNEKELPEFKWNPFPEHLLNKFNNLLYKWYIKWCIPTNEEMEKRTGGRRKALLLYSKQRNMGKTRFAKNLVNNEGYYVYFRSTFNKDIDNNENTKLLILDDMEFTKKNIETWKALVASEEGSIRDCYVNEKWNHKVPCIINTNNKDMFNYFCNDDSFNTQVICIEVDEYIGPPGTQTNEFSTKEIYIKNKIFDIFKNEKHKENINEYKENIIDEIDYINTEDKTEKYMKLENECLKLKEKLETITFERDVYLLLKNMKNKNEMLELNEDKNISEKETDITIKYIKLQKENEKLNKKLQEMEETNKLFNREWIGILNKAEKYNIHSAYVYAKSYCGEIQSKCENIKLDYEEKLQEIKYERDVYKHKFLNKDEENDKDEESQKETLKDLKKRQISINNNLKC